MEKEKVILTKSYPFSKYWLRLLRDINIIEEHLANSLLADCEGLLKILFSIIKSSKATN